MKNLLKKSVVAFAAAISLTACTESTWNGTQTYTLIKEIETTNFETGVNASYELNYKRHTIENGDKKYYIPMLTDVSGTNGEFSSVKYSYSKDDDDTILQVELTDRTGQHLERYKLNGLGMASQKEVAGVFTKLENVEYNSSGYRTKWNDVALVSDGGVYVSVNKDNKPVINFDYTPYSNPFGIQQFGIAGPDLYLNFADVFGKQSRQLLNGFATEENGEKVRYDFKYSLDGATGIVVEELIYRDDEKFMKTKYTYTSVTYSEEDDAAATM